MADYPPFASPSDLEAFVGHPVDSTQAASMLGQASALMRTKMGWHVYPSVTESLTLDGPDSATLFLPSLYVSAINSVTEDGTLLDPSEYGYSVLGYVRRLTRVVWNSGQVTTYTWTANLQGVVVNLTHGFEKCPAELTAVCVQMAARAMATTDSAVRQRVGHLMADYNDVGLTPTDAELAILNYYSLLSA